MKPVSLFTAVRQVRLARQVGVTLVELMVAMVIGLVVVIALSAVFVSSSTSRREVESSADVIENGRYALDAMSRELTQAGFYGPLISPPSPGISNVGKLCSTTLTEWADSLRDHVVGLGSVAGVTTDASPACLTDRKDGTDAMFVQRAATCTSVECAPEVAAKAYLQVSECGDEYSAGSVLVVRPGNDAGLTLKTKACGAAKADRRQLIRRIYYVSSADVLSYVDVAPGGVSAPVGIVENIEQMQVSYGIDIDGDGTADTFSASTTAADWPLPATPCLFPSSHTCDWRDVVGARVWLLARSTDPSRNAGNAASFVLDDTTVSVTAADRNLKRRVYSTYISFITPTLRRQQP